MIRQTIILGGFTYLVDLYKAKIDMLDLDLHYSNFVMLRKYEFTNNIAADSEIYIIEKSVMDNVLSTLSTDLVTSLIAFPIKNVLVRKFSKCFKDFNSDFEQTNLTYSNEIYPLLNSDKKYAKIVCDKVRIYHPHNQNQQKFIIHFDNYINNIHYHYFCRPSFNFNVNAYETFDVNNLHYAEYIEFYIPNIEHLFSDDIYFKDNLNISYINGKLQTSGDDLEHFSLLNKPWTIQTVGLIKENSNRTNIENVDSEDLSDVDLDDDNYVRVYVDIEKSIETNYLTAPVNITLFPYSESGNIYDVHSYLEPNSDTFFTECRFRLGSHLGFSDGNVALINKFTFPNQLWFINKNDGDEDKALAEAYLEYNSVSWEDYLNIQIPEDLLTDEEIESTEYVKSLGFVIEISSDNLFLHVIYRNCWNVNSIANFSFSLNHIFDSWDQYPEILMVRSTFVDRLLLVNLRSNVTVITKDWFKYMVYNNEAGNRLELFVDLQSNKEYEEHHIVIENESYYENDLTDKDDDGEIYEYKRNELVDSDPVLLIKTTLYKLGIRNDSDQYDWNMNATDMWGKDEYFYNSTNTGSDEGSSEGSDEGSNEGSDEGSSDDGSNEILSASYEIIQKTTTTTLAPTTTNSPFGSDEGSDEGSDDVINADYLYGDDRPYVNDYTNNNTFYITSLKFKCKNYPDESGLPNYVYDELTKTFVLASDSNYKSYQVDEFYCEICRFINNEIVCVYSSINSINFSLYTKINTFIPEFLMYCEDERYKYIPLDETIYIRFRAKYIGSSNNIISDSDLIDNGIMPVPLSMIYTDEYGKVITSESIILEEDNFSDFIDIEQGESLFPEINIGYRKNLNNASYDEDSPMDLSNFNFIDKFKCISMQEVKTATITTDDLPIALSSKIIYEPFFYRGFETTEALILHEGITHYIGINLSAYFSDYKLFALQIGTMTSTEMARNGVYVLFKVNTLYMYSDSGSGDYYIVNGNNTEEDILQGTYYVS